ncbi:hypothetical protein [Phaeospirillum tilakii]|uniref:Methylaspartate ammonia-lyase n=1 Tax=Phaeospirillum tilakii TaxID=741673 RepID=A0ABW5C9B7_9PROT
MTPPAWADSCATLAARVAAVPGAGPVLLASFDDVADRPALATAAFTYDNAVAAIALVACGRESEARRIGAALTLAARHGRLRNAYRGGAQPDPPPPNGWWDAAQGRWVEDSYQVGTSSGVVAWAGLALLTVGGAEARAAAAALGQWLLAEVADRRGAGGFTGGIDGEGQGERRLTWKSAEHQTDLIALFGGLARSGAPGPWPAAEAAARRMLDSLWLADEGRFLVGTLPDGVSPNRANSGLDAQLWPTLLAGAAPDWRRALAYAERAHGVPGGFSFAADRAGLWCEGTAQAALAWRAAGRPERTRALLATLAGQVSPGGYLWATPETRLPTGLAIGPDSVSADFFYYRWPHLGATAWTALAEQGWNPFTGRRVGAGDTPRGAE